MIKDQSMYLRELRKTDAPLMMEWMHDKDVIRDLKADFMNKTLRDCELFIANSHNTSQNMHLAIANDNDEYMGTVSLKHIKEKKAEFGITIRRSAMGKGYSKFAMDEIIRIAKKRLCLERIFWCVDPNNTRALRFYDKQGYLRIKAPRDTTGYSEEEKSSLIWYESILL